MRSTLIFVLVFLGGQTVIVGNVISIIGRVSIVVFIGLWFQLEKELMINKIAIENPEKMIKIQNNLEHFLEDETCCMPWIVEESRNGVNSFMVFTFVRADSGNPIDTLDRTSIEYALFIQLSLYVIWAIITKTILLSLPY